MESLWILSGLFTAALALGGLEFWRHQTRIRSIPVRVHVNGTRGKSSVTRLIGAGLRAGGLPTLVKVTGTFPRLLLEDGRELEIRRRGGANILEQLGIVAFAASRRPRALVMECMALEPRNQWITEHQMLHATVGVITNIRLDHCDVMGYRIDEIASALGGTVPRDSVLFTAEDEMAPRLRRLAEERDSGFFRTRADTVRPEELERFSYLEHAENIALALGVCQHLGVPRERALEGMVQAEPDAGALTCSRVLEDGREIFLYNAFAANDPDSTLRVWKWLQAAGRLHGRQLLLLNSRRDRMDRSYQLVDLVLGELAESIDHLLLMGENTRALVQRLGAGGFSPSRLSDLGEVSAPRQVFTAVATQACPRATVLTIGNMGGLGAATVDYFHHRRARHG